MKKRLYNIISSPNNPSKASKIFDIIIIVLIVINILTAILDTFKIPQWLMSVSSYIELISVIIFTVEYLMRVYVSDIERPNMPPVLARLHYMASFMAVIDLLAILPFYIPFIITIDLRVLRILRIFRLLRILKLNRYTSALNSLGEVFRRKKHQLITSVGIVVLLMIISSVLMYNVENEAQPEVFDNALTSLWWTVETLTTVGYGDIVPVTAVGKLLSTVISLLGIGLVAVPTGIISAGFSEIIAEKREHDNDNEKVYCPYCGKKIK